MRVTAFGAGGRWVEVRPSRTTRIPAGRLDRARLRTRRPAAAGEDSLAFPPVYGVVGEPADVALAPYPLAARGGRLAKGTVVEIHSVDHSYFAFRDKTWGLAFVNSAAVDLIPPDPREPAISPKRSGR